MRKRTVAVLLAVHLLFTMDAGAQRTKNCGQGERAIAEISYPKLAAPGSGRHNWTTVFTETGGKIGFKLSETNFHLVDPKGARWSSSRPGKTVDVRAGGKASDSHWVHEDSKWDGGTYYRTWIGEDECGNPLKFDEAVRLGQ